MKKVLLALTLALSMAPLAALAQNAPPADGPPALTDQQRQEMFNTFKQIRTQEETLHKQLRAQVLATLTPIHRRTVADLIGQLAIAQNPDRDATVKQLDALLSGAEKNEILNAHTTYLAQSKTLHEQAMKQMQQYLPAGGPPQGEHRPNLQGKRHGQSNDPGEILLRILTDERGGHGMMPFGPPMGRPQQ